MQQNSVRHCPACGQALRFPENVGGVTMACPNCGHRFTSTFKLAGAPRSVHMSPQPATPPTAPTAIPTTEDAPPVRTTLAARVAALYASKAS